MSDPPKQRGPGRCARERTVFVGRHGEGTYLDYIQSSQAKDSIRNATLRRYISEDALYRIRKWNDNSID